MRTLVFTLGLLCILPGPHRVSAQSDELTAEEAIRSALSAAPRSVTDGATIVAGTLPPMEGNQAQRVLREGDNGWVCMPDNPNVPGDSPACVDEAWEDFLAAFLSGEPAPEGEEIGISYMLRGDFPTSNVDPSASGPTDENEWIQDSGPHLMIVLPDRSLLEGLSESPGKGPWVMWPDTPYAHIMVPVPGMPRH